MSRVQISVGANDVATAIALKLSPLTVEPTRFKPNNGKLNILFGKSEQEKEGLLIVTAELQGNIVAEFEFSLAEFALSPREALETLASELKQAHGAAMYRRNHEQNITNKMFAELAP